MTSAARILMVIMVGGVLLMAATVATAAVALYGAGSIAVEVHEDHGNQFSVRIPAAIANLALTLVPERVVDEALDEVTTEIEPYVPAIRDAWSRLGDSGDFVLVEVNGADEHVSIRKVDNRLLITVGDHDNHVEVALPLKTIGKILHRL